MLTPVRTIVTNFNETGESLRTISRNEQTMTRWRKLSPDAYTATPASTSQITMSDTSLLQKGFPLQYKYNDTSYYGLVHDLSASASCDIAGAPLDTAHDLQALYVGHPSTIMQMQFYEGSTCLDAVSYLICRALWLLGPAYLVTFACRVRVQDSGANMSKINFYCGGANAVSNNDSDLGIQARTTWTQNPQVDIDTTHYAITYGEDVAVRVTANGSNHDSEDISVSAAFVLA